MNHERDVYLALAVASVSFFVGCLIASNGKLSQIEKEAIKAGVAYYTNNASGESVFKWKECK